MDVPVTDPDDAEPQAPPPPPPGAPSPPPPGASSPTQGLWAWFASLRRSTSDSMVAGVASGLASSLGVPVVLVRAGFVIAVFTGLGIPLYLLGWVFVPTDRGDRVVGGSRRGDLLALAALVVAGLQLLSLVTEVSLIRLGWRLAPWTLLLVGLALLLRRDDGTPPPWQRPGTTTAPPPPPPGTPYDSETRMPRAAPGDATRPDVTRVDPTGPASTTAAAPTTAAWAATGVAGTTSSVPTPTPVAPPAPRVRLQPPVIGALTWCAVLIVCGVLGIAAAAGIDLFSPGVIASVALVVFGVGLVVSAFIGRARGLILPALALAVALGGLGALDLRADVLGAPFERTISSASLLPTSLSTTAGSSSLDLRHLTLDRDRELRIEHFGGTLEIGLPASTTATITIETSYGDTELVTPSMADVTWGDPELATRWATDGMPEDGAALTDDVAVDNRWWWSLPTRTETLSDGATQSTVRRTFDNDSEHTLRIDVQMGVGRVQVNDPHWSRGSQTFEEPVQLCTEAGGPRGVVDPCGSVPVADRVALCINESDYLVDCRADRPGTPDWPRVAACRGFTGEHQPCDHFGIDPVGAELITPGATDDEGLEEGFDESFDEGLDPDTPTTSPTETVAPPATPSVPEGAS